MQAMVTLNIFLFFLGHVQVFLNGRYASLRIICVNTRFYTLSLLEFVFMLIFGVTIDEGGIICEIQVMNSMQTCNSVTFYFMKKLIF